MIPRRFGTGHPKKFRFCPWCLLNLLNLFPAALVPRGCEQLLPAHQPEPCPLQECDLANAQLLQGGGWGGGNNVKSSSISFYPIIKHFEGLQKQDNSFLQPTCTSFLRHWGQDTQKSKYVQLESGGQVQHLAKGFLSISKWSYGVLMLPKVLVCCCLGQFPWSPLSYPVRRMLNSMASFANCKIN